MREEKEVGIPIWEKLLLTTDEAMEYTGIYWIFVYLVILSMSLYKSKF